jgi:hypothetical protein
MATINNNFKDPGIHKIPPRVSSKSKTMDSSTNMMKPAIRSTAGDNSSVHPDFAPIGLTTHGKIGR